MKNSIIAKRLARLLANELDRLTGDGSSSRKSSEEYIQRLSEFADALEREASDIRGITIPAERSILGKE